MHDAKDGTRILAITREEAADLIGFLAAQLAETGSQRAPLLTVITEGDPPKKSFLSVLVER
jgi:hypothetical protein